MMDHAREWPPQPSTLIGGLLSLAARSATYTLTASTTFDDGRVIIVCSEVLCS
jgi:hypothetical protein